MPYVNIRVTPPGITREQKADVIKGVTEVLVRVLGKNPAQTFIVIDEVDPDNWGASGEQVSELLKRHS